jgi:DNA repair protein RecO (recombination protein O)
MNEIVDQAYVLHSYRYRETSAIMDLFSLEHGRISVVAKGVKSPKSKLKSVLQPFLKLQIEARGKSHLKTLTMAEPIAAPIVLGGTRLVSALYVNELLVRLLHKEEVCERLFACYEHTIEHLQSSSVEVLLRQFEKELVETLGYALPFDFTADTHQPICASENYLFVPEYGFTLRDNEPVSSKLAVFSGQALQAISRGDFSSPEALKAAKQLFRLVLQPLLGNKPLKSRDILLAMMDR